MISSESRNSTLILRIDEPRVDMVVARKFREGLSAFLKDKPARIVLDLKQTEYFDSSALGALVAFMKDVKAYGGELVLCNLSRSLLTLLKLSKLDMLFTISDDLEKAVR
jgi:anti-sigma B factor antagonist